MPTVNVDDAATLSSRVAEQNVAGSMIHDEGCIDPVRDVVAADDFLHPVCRLVFEAAVALKRDNQPVESGSVYLWLRANRARENVKVDQLADLIELAPTAANAEYYARVVARFAARRRLVYDAAEVIARAYDTDDSAELAAVASKMASSIEAAANGVGRPVPLHEAVTEALVRIDERRTNERAAGIQTGFADLDLLVAGMRPGQMVVIAARPGIGKTAIALNLLLNAAKAGHRSLFISLEMAAGEIAERLLAVAGPVEMHRLARGRFSPQEGEAVLRTAQAVREAATRIEVADSPHMTTAAIAAAARRAVRRGGAKLLCLDYLQLVRPQNLRDSRADQVGHASRSMKILARECGVPVICLAQLNRDVEDRPDRRPRLSDIRNSGDIEQDADAVILLHIDPKEAEERRDAPTVPVELIVAKQRNGPLGTAHLVYHKPNLKYTDYSPSDG
jgi:replicative DNA helicase